MAGVKPFTSVEQNLIDVLVDSYRDERDVMAAAFDAILDADPNLARRHAAARHEASWEAEALSVAIEKALSTLIDMKNHIPLDFQWRFDKGESFRIFFRQIKRRSFSTEYNKMIARAEHPLHQTIVDSSGNERVVEVADVNGRTPEEMLSDHDDLRRLKIALSHLKPTFSFAMVLHHGLFGSSDLLRPDLSPQMLAERLTFLAREWGFNRTDARSIGRRGRKMMERERAKTRTYEPRGEGIFSQRQLAELLDLSEAAVSRVVERAMSEVQTYLDPATPGQSGCGGRGSLPSDDISHGVLAQPQLAADQAIAAPLPGGMA